MVKPTGCRDIEIRKFEVVAKSEFLNNIHEIKLVNQISTCPCHNLPVAAGLVNLL